MNLNATNRLLKPDYVVRTADKSVNSTSTVADDSVLQFDVLADEGYWVEAYIVYIGSGNFKCGWASSAGTLEGSLQVVRYDTSSTAFQNTTGPTTAQSSGSSATIKRVVIIQGFLRNNADATVKFQWSQSAINASDQTVKAGSFIRYRRMA